MLASLYRRTVREIARRAPKDRNRADYYAAHATIYGADAAAVIARLQDVEAADLAAFFARLAAHMAAEAIACGGPRG